MAEKKVKKEKEKGKKCGKRRAKCSSRQGVELCAQVVLVPVLCESEKLGICPRKTHTGALFGIPCQQVHSEIQPRTLWVFLNLRLGTSVVTDSKTEWSPASYATADFRDELKKLLRSAKKYITNGFHGSLKKADFRLERMERGEVDLSLTDLFRGVGYEGTAPIMRKS